MMSSQIHGYIYRHKLLRFSVNLHQNSYVICELKFHEIDSQGIGTD